MMSKWLFKIILVISIGYIAISPVISLSNPKGVLLAANDEQADTDSAPVDFEDTDFC